MRAADDALERLRAAIDRLAADDASELLVQARSEARARVRTMLADAFTDSMLEHLRARLDGSPEAAPEPKRRTRGPVAETMPAERTRYLGGSEKAWYVYGVVGKDQVLSTPLPTGVESEQSVCIVREGDLAAIASRVPLADFDEAELRAHLADMDWVERVARRHEEVLEQVGREATVIPMRMCTVYRSEDGVREMLRREAVAFAEALVHLNGRSEWGVKVVADPVEVRAKIAARDRPADAPVSGTAYMEQRRREREDAEHAAQLLEQSVAEIHQSLGAAAVESLVLAPQRSDASGRNGEMVLNGVYLVDDDALESFHDRVNSLQSEFEWCGLQLEPTGPWPPYNFVPGAIGAAW